MIWFYFGTITLMSVYAKNYLSVKNFTFFAIGMAIHRLIWAGSICGLIYECCCCCTICEEQGQQGVGGRGGEGGGNVINWILSLPMWKPLDRINYGVYLIHSSLILMEMKQLRYDDGGTFTIFLWLQKSFGIYVIALFVAIPIHVFIEMPFKNLESDWKLLEKWKNTRLKRF